MINFDSLTLKALITEINEKLLFARVQKIQMISRREMIFTLRNHGENFKFFVSIEPEMAYCAITQTDTTLVFPQTPPMFCMLLRKHLESMKIIDVKTIEHERILELTFEVIQEFGQHKQLVLAFEFMGKYSNVILYNRDTKMIIGCAHNVGEEKSSVREVMGNIPYIYPLLPKKLDLSLVPFDYFSELSNVIRKPFNIWLNETFFDITIPLANQICRFHNIVISEDKIVSISQEKLKDIYNTLQNIVNLKNLKPCISEDFSEYSLFFDEKIKCNSINEMVSTFFNTNKQKLLLEKKKKSIMNLITKELKKIDNVLKKLNNSEELSSRTEKYKQIADSLMANLNKDFSNMEKIILENVYTQENMEVILNPALTTSENAQHYYKLYNKFKRSKEFNIEQIKKYNFQKEYYEGLKISTDLADSIKILEEIEDEIKPNKNIKQSKKQTVNIMCEEKGGFQIYVGKNNKQNDYIISKIASKEDIWLHVHGNFGSHVLIKLKDKKEPDENIIYYAATLAAKYSNVNTDKKAEVLYCKRKYIKKPPGAPLGYVTYENEKTVVVDNI